jgi:hypothetical protein
LVALPMAKAAPKAISAPIAANAASRPAVIRCTGRAYAAPSYRGSCSE